jgi:hypothetical protein
MAYLNYVLGFLLWWGAIPGSVETNFVQICTLPLHAHEITKQKHPILPLSYEIIELLLSGLLQKKRIS